MSNQSGASSNHVSAVSTRILKIGDQRLARETGRMLPKIQEIAPQRLSNVSLTCGNDGPIFATRTLPHRDGTDWLGREDSNSQMSFPKIPFEMWGEFPLILEHYRTRDFSRARCLKRNMHLPAELAVGWQNSNWSLPTIFGYYPLQSCASALTLSRSAAPVQARGQLGKLEILSQVRPGLRSLQHLYLDVTLSLGFDMQPAPEGQQCGLFLTGWPILQKPSLAGLRGDRERRNKAA
jgi:hypothetical protein